MWKDLVDLVTVTVTQDSYANEVRTETTQSVYCNIKGVMRSEFYSALAEGLKPSITVEMRAEEYSDQEYVIANGKRYKVQRTYPIRWENVELTCGEVTL